MTIVNIFCWIKHCTSSKTEKKNILKSPQLCYYHPLFFAVCPRSLDPFCIVPYNLKWIKSSWTYDQIFQKGPMTVKI